MKKTNVMKLAMTSAIAVAGIDNASAASASKAKGHLSELVGNASVSNTLTFLLLFYAFYLWFEWGHNLEPKSALKTAWLPAMVTFFALKWQEVLGWFGII